ncbi:MAG: FAD-dependent oxidoreductase [Anaerolineaceae bacterium]|nr:FAD-dependent oxidoreductase [Anaerolineaceae bacterium]
MKRNQKQKFILGGGVTGLSAGITSGLPVLEAALQPGGICSSYYVRPGSQTRLPEAPADDEAYRFEIGGGHWIFGGDPTILHFIQNMVPVKRYSRRSAVYFSGKNLYVPYPLQNHLRYLDEETVTRVLQELATTVSSDFVTMKEWLRASFGPTLCDLFFDPFHDLYTAGLYDRIAPQDAYKSPVSMAQVIRGAFQEAAAVGYNVTFLYPQNGLNQLAQRMAAQCDIRYNHRIVAIDPANRRLTLSSGDRVTYDTLLSTLPLNRMIEMTGLEVPGEAEPYTSVLVLNIGAKRGQNCPTDHWLYNPDTRSGFHRVGFYSNVDASFLPQSARRSQDRVSIYIERAFVGGSKPTAEEVKQYATAVVQELQEWGFITEAEVVDPTWIDVAYTWSRPGSTWKAQALHALEEQGIYQVGRYARWVFQGIADSIKDGFYAGACLREHETHQVPAPMLNHNRVEQAPVSLGD